MNTIYAEVTGRIIVELEKGAAPWIKPWRADATADKNVVSQKPYQGINRLILGLSSMANGFSNPAWASYKQWQSLGANVLAGSKGTKIVFFQPVTVKEDKQTGEKSSYALLKTYTVFNAQQTDIPVVPTENPVVDFDPIPQCERRILATGAAISHGGDAAFYSPAHDRIQLPQQSSFHSVANYYATAFHELAHWTGAKHRLDRKLEKGRFGNPEYAFEELVAEMSAAFLCADHGIAGELRHAGYIQSWLKALRDDKTAIFKASALAQKAASYIMAQELAEQAA